MARTQTTSTPFARAIAPDLVDVWAARAALAMAAHAGRESNLADVVESVAQLRGLRPRAAARFLQAFIGRRPRTGNLLVDNARKLGARLRLTALETDLLAFAAAAHAYTVVDEAIVGLERAPFFVAARVIGHALGADAASIARAVTAGPLVTSALLRFDSTDRIPLKVDPTIAAALAFPAESADALLEPFFRKASAPSLDRAAFAYIAPHVDLAVSLLRNPGVNVLLYGPPGTGKSQLARIIAHEAARDLYEVPVDGAGGHSRSGDARLVAYKLCQRVLGPTAGAAILFDEIEDVWQRQLIASTHSLKGSTNRVLEESTVPAIWIGNEVEHLDPAFVRRFDLVVEVRVPPRSQKRALADALLPTVREDVRARIASARDVSPAMIARTAQSIALARPADASAAASLAIEQTLGAMGKHARLPRMDAGYDLAFVECDADLGHIVRMLAERPTLRALLVGPPGTGKTAFVRHTAQALGRPLVEKRASELLSMWVGGTEKNVAHAFREAKEENAVLFFDEVDGMLADRAQANQSWEVTQVGQILVDMEDYEGVFFASTNLVDRVDPAAMRRFELRVRFSSLRLERRVAAVDALLDQLCPHATGADRDAALALVRDLHGVCLGDLAAVRRRAPWLALREPIDVVTELAREIAGKRGAPRAFGFTRDEVRAVSQPSATR